MTVLVTGTRAATEAAVRALQEAGAGVEHFGALEPAVAHLARAPERYALVLAESAGNACADRRFLDSVRAAAAEIPVLLIREPGAPAGAGDVPPVCAVERTPEGLQLLRCALARAQAQPERQPALAEALGERPLVFAYSAPAKVRSG